MKRLRLFVKNLQKGNVSHRVKPMQDLDKPALLHKIRNCLGPLQTFLEVVDLEKADPEIRAFHERCKVKFAELKELLEVLDKKIV